MVYLAAVIVVGTLVAMTSGKVPTVLALGTGLAIAGITRVAPPAALFSGLSNGGVITVAAMLVIAKGIMATGVITRVTWRLLSTVSTARQALRRLALPIGVASALDEHHADRRDAHPGRQRARADAAGSRPSAPAADRPHHHAGRFGDAHRYQLEPADRGNRGRERRRSRDAVLRRGSAACRDRRRDRHLSDGALASARRADRHHRPDAMAGGDPGVLAGQRPRPHRSRPRGCHHTAVRAAVGRAVGRATRRHDPDRGGGRTDLRGDRRRCRRAVGQPTLRSCTATALRGLGEQRQLRHPAGPGG